jgi:hypothetical protein
MANLTDHTENLLLNWLMTAGAATRPTAWFVALGTGSSDAAGVTGEPSGNGYARQALTVATVSGGATDNNGTITFGPCTGSNWGTMSHVAIYDASTSGNPLWHGALTDARTINVGDSLTIATGALDLSLT